MSEDQRRETTRAALSLIRADWQGDDVSWRRVWQECPDHEALTRELAHLCRETMERLASVGGVSTGEMLHRQAVRLIPSDQSWSTAALDAESGRHRAEPTPDPGLPDEPGTAS